LYGQTVSGFGKCKYVPVQLKRGHGRDTALRGDVIQVVDVNLDEHHVLELGSQLLEVRADHLARAAPGRGEVDEKLKFFGVGREG
jgi:hypothetical protein